MPDKEKQKGRVLEILRMSTEDGPGLRTTVFMKGCPLQCRWCHNPESISPDFQTHWLGPSRCIDCGLCLEVCPNSALSSTDEGIIIDRTLCQGCGMCAEECPSTALELLGQFWSVEELYEEVMKDKAYFQQLSGKTPGGITFSGGEPLLQSDFITTLLRKIKEQDGIHCALDTCGQVPFTAFEKVFSSIDLFLFDLKVINPQKHKQFTEVDNQRILANFTALTELMEQNTKRPELWIRTAIIPGMTDNAEVITEIADFLLSTSIETITRWELCAFNNLCIDKYRRLGERWEFSEAPLIPAETMDGLVENALSRGFPESKILWTGPVREPYATVQGS